MTADVWHRCQNAQVPTMPPPTGQLQAAKGNYYTFGIDAKCLLLWPTNGMPAGIWHRCQTVQVPTVTRFMTSTFGIDVKRLLLWPTKVLLYWVPSPTSTKGYNSTTPHDVSRGTFPLRPITTAPCTAPSDPTSQLFDASVSSSQKSQIGRVRNCPKSVPKCSNYPKYVDFLAIDSKSMKT